MSVSPGVRRGRAGSKAVNVALDDAVRADSFAKVDLPAAADHNGKIVYCSNGGAAGAACLAYSNGTAWLIVALGAAIS